MTDLNKALEYRNKKLIQDKIDSDTGANEVRLQSLETTRTNAENADAPGSTTSFSGKVQVAEELKVLGNIEGTTGTFSGAVTAQNEKLATENFVLANAGGGGAAGNVDVTNTYRFEATEGQTDFTFHFIGASVGVYLGGLKLDTTDYSLTAATYDADDVLVTESYVTLTEGASDGEIFHGVAFGGADFYSKTQTDAQFMSRQDILDTYATKTELQTAISDASEGCYVFGRIGDDSSTSKGVANETVLPLVNVTSKNITVNSDNITIVKEGLYQISYLLEIEAEASGRWGCSIIINDVKISNSVVNFIDGSGWDQNAQTIAYPLNIGDKIEIRTESIPNNATYWAGDAASSNSTYSVSRIGDK